MSNLLLFILLSLPLLLLSWRALFQVKSHGFYRFFAWEGILWLFLSNYPHWFVRPLAVHQVFSWILLFASLYLVIVGVVQMKKRGKARQSRTDEALYAFERTTELVDTGIFKYIRHPLYASLLYLAWGICLKNPGFQMLCVALLVTVFLYLTAKADERECLEYFGDKYVEYRKRSKMFVPFVF